MYVMQTTAARILQERLEPLLGKHFLGSVYTNYERGKIFYYNGNKSAPSGSTKSPLGIDYVYKLITALIGHKPMYTSNELQADECFNVGSLVRAMSLVNKAEIKSMYLGAYRRSSAERNGGLEGEAYDLVITFCDKEALPLLVRFGTDGYIVDYTSTSLNVALRYDFLLESGEIIRDANLSNILAQSVVEGVPRLEGKVPVRGDNYFSQVGWDLEQCLRYSNNFNDLSMFAGLGYETMSTSHIDNFARIAIYPKLGLKFIPSLKFLEAFEEKIKQMVSLLDDAPEYYDEDIKDTASTPNYNNTEEEKTTMLNEQLNKDKQKDGAAKKERPCASCIDSILKNADLGINDFQRHAIVGLMAMAFDMEIPD